MGEGTSGTGNLAPNLAWTPSWASADFFTSLSNQQAFRAVSAAPDSAEATELWGHGQVLLLLGAVGSGKTHLAHIWSEQRQVRGAPAAQFLRPRLTRDQWHALQPQEQDGFVLDGLASVLGDHEQEVGFQHFLDAVRRVSGARLLLTARDEDSVAQAALPDLRTRLATIARCAIQPPDDLLLEAVLSKLFHDRQIRPNQQLLKWLLSHRERSYASALAVVSQLDEAALQRRRKVNIALVKEIFS